MRVRGPATLLPFALGSVLLEPGRGAARSARVDLGIDALRGIWRYRPKPSQRTPVSVQRHVCVLAEGSARADRYALRLEEAA